MQINAHALKALSVPPGDRLRLNSTRQVKQHGTLPQRQALVIWFGAYMEVEMDWNRVEGNWKKAMVLASAAIIGIALLSGGAEAQGTLQTVDLAKVDVQKLAAGYRASKVIGSSVVNDANETIGKIDDLLVSLDGKEPYAVISIGGFLGMGTHLVVVPYDTLKFAEGKVMLAGVGTKEGLKMLPEFKYATE